MADENTITTIFRANIDQFSASTQEMRRYMGQVNAEFAEATAGMGKWSDSTDGLSAKLKQLDGTLQAQKKQLSALEEEYNSLTDEQKQSTIQGQKLATAILKQRADVKKTESQIDSYSASLKELTDAGVKTKQELDDLNKKIKDNGDQAESTAGKIAKGLGKGLLGLGTAVVGAGASFLGLAESTREFRKEQAQLETAFDKAGFSAEQMKNHYSDFNAVLGDTKKTTETMQQLADFAKTEEELADYTNILTGVFATYGDALPTESLAEAINHTISLGSQVEGSLADAFEWAGVNVDDFNKQLEKCTTEEERSALISEKLNELYGEQAEHYKENNKEIIEATKAETKMTQAMAELGKVAEPIATMLKSAFGDLLVAITPFVQLMGEGLKGAFEGSADGAKKFAEGLTGMAKTLLDKVNSLIPTIVDIVLQLIPSLIQAILDALPALVSTLSQVISQIVVGLGKMIPQIVTAIVDAIPQIVQAILDAQPVFLDAVLQFAMAIIEALPTIVEQIVNALPTLITSIVDALVTFIPQVVDGAITLLMAIVDAIPVIIEALIPQIPTIVNSIIDGLLSMLPVLLDGALKLMMAIIDAIPLLITKLVPQIPKIVTTIVKTLTSKIDVLIQGALQLLEGIIDAIPLMIKELIPHIPEIITSIVDGLIEGVPDIMEVGVELIKGLWEGIKSMASWLWEKIKGFGEKITGWFKGIFGIESPSKLFRDEIGKNLALGIGEGFNDEMGHVNDEMQKSLEKLTPSLGIDTASLSAGTLGGLADSQLEKLANLVASKTTNITNNYKFDYTFEKMETSKLALHKATLETKRAIGG